MIADPSTGRRPAPAVPSAGADAQHAAWRRKCIPQVEQVRDGVWSLPTPIPQNPLRYTLAYAIESADGLVLIDSGWLSDETWIALKAGVRETGHGVGDISDVLLTHTHIDHHGLTRRVVDASGARVHMHGRETRSLDGARSGGVDLSRWLDERGAPPAAATELVAELGHEFGTAELSSLMRPDCELDDGDRPIAALPELRAVFTPGHTTGHTCYLLESEGLLFAGDHLLPRITPHITRAPGDGGDAVGDYFDSLRIVGALDVDEVLPAHEYRFAGVRERVQSMLAHHAERLDEIEAAVPGSTWDIAAAITWSRGWAAAAGIARQLAVSETLAHLAHLDRTHRLNRAPQAHDLWEISR